ncbi:hypothetical protein [Serinicoccus marinus]|uniref:hypothetical protein n=1 Tax=Serinicoccus marinus TaxID=247333 RepID=UPI0003B45E42|nr:hypothetical protein [Serinicoccus marinus]
MASGWTPARVVRWPAQQQDRAWCAQRAIPCLLLVDDGAAAPEPGPSESVLPQTADEHRIAGAVDELSWRAAAAAAPAPEPERLAHPSGRRRSVVGLVAALF